ncbi:MAG: hypothetical protein H0X47_02475 [Nitrospirales bacterium]|nr:hypothetical protein [Nitrospirales bacterium]
MVVEIDHEDWGNVTVNPETILRVSREIDREGRTTEFEMKKIETRTSQLRALASCNRTIPIRPN